MQKLTIITACSRPENLYRIAESLEPGWDLFDLEWKVVCDAAKVNPRDWPDVTCGVYDPRSQFGNAQKNYALDSTRDGWVYFLDDDNLIHPDFFPTLAQILDKLPNIRGLLFAQELSAGVRLAVPDRVTVGQIDLAQYVLRRDLIGERRFVIDRYEADGHFIMGLFWQDPSEFGISTNPLAYYNRLKDDPERIPVPVLQDHLELAALRKMVMESQPRRILEIGSMYGGTLWAWMRDNPGATVVSVDMPVTEMDSRYQAVHEAREEWGTWAIQNGCHIIPLTGNSTSGEIIERAAKCGPYDFILVDGGHDYATAKADYENCWPMLREGGMMAFHDIAYPDDNPHGFEVGRLWQEIKTAHADCQELINIGGIWGIGLVRKESANG